MNKKKVLVFIGYYLPGFKSGGPVRSLSNMVSHLCEYVDFYIVTRDHDLGSVTPYDGIDVKGGWDQVDGANVLYVPDGLSLAALSDVINKVGPDCYYFNSFFDFRFSILPVLYLRLLGVLPKRVIVAPRGEFADAALSLKSTKKSVFIWLSKLFRIYHGVRFHASSNFEKDDIQKNFLSGAEISVAMDLPGGLNHGLALLPRQISTVIRLVFLSRISPMKNLDYALRALQGVSRRVDFHIYGPIEDKEYWSTCMKLVLQFPDNIQVQYCGAAEQSKVLDTLSAYDLLFLPSRGENYCHVIAESLSVGTPVLISDKTPWRGLEQKGLGWDFPLSAPSLFAEIINDFELPSADADFERRSEIITKYMEYILLSDSISDNKRLFECLCVEDGIK